MLQKFILYATLINTDKSAKKKSRSLQISSENVEFSKTSKDSLKTFEHEIYTSEEFHMWSVVLQIFMEIVQNLY